MFAYAFLNFAHFVFFSNRMWQSRSTGTSASKYLGPSQSLTRPVRCGMALNVICNRLCAVCRSLSLNALRQDVAISFNNESSSTETPMGRSSNRNFRLLLFPRAIPFRINRATPCLSVLLFLNFAIEHIFSTAGDSTFVTFSKNLLRSPSSGGVASSNRHVRKLPLLILFTLSIDVGDTPSNSEIPTAVLPSLASFTFSSTDVRDFCTAAKLSSAEVRHFSTSDVRSRKEAAALSACTRSAFSLSRAPCRSRAFTNSLARACSSPLSCPSAFSLSNSAALALQRMVGVCVCVCCVCVVWWGEG